MARVYATEQDYRDWLDDQTATASDAVLARASLLVDRALIGAVYPVDDETLLPTEAEHIEALRDATCAQVQWWDETGDTTGTGAAGQWQSASIGSANYQRAGRDSGGSSDGKSPADRIAPQVFDVLHVAGLLPVNVCTNG